jgi:hypothetical protein
MGCVGLKQNKRMKIKSSLKRLEALATAKLRTSFDSGEYITERATDFWRNHNQSSVMFLGNGERQVFCSGLKCKPLKLTGHSMLVALVDSNSLVWYSWIHA